METQLLRDPGEFPDKEVLQQALGNSYHTFEKFTEAITAPEYGLTLEWRYYNDGKAWLCKVSFKKKTVFWLSVWNPFFKTSFFFTEKHLEGIKALDISENIKENFSHAKQVGRLIPLIMNIDNPEQLKDLLTVTGFKKSLK